MKTEKHTDWMGIAWPRATKPPTGQKPVVKKLVVSEPITEKQALAEFRKAFPGLRNYTIQPA